MLLDDAAAPRRARGGDTGHGLDVLLVGERKRNATTRSMQFTSSKGRNVSRTTFVWCASSVARRSVVPDPVAVRRCINAGFDVMMRIALWNSGCNRP